MFENDSSAEKDLTAKIARSADDFLTMLEATDCDTAALSVEFTTIIGGITVTAKLEMKADVAAPF